MWYVTISWEDLRAPAAHVAPHFDQIRTLEREPSTRIGLSYSDDVGVQRNFRTTGAALNEAPEIRPSRKEKMQTRGWIK